MIGRRRGSPGPGALELPARARAAARSVGESVSVPKGGLAGVLARALGRGGPRPVDPEAAPREADTGELRALREELTRELERIDRAEIRADGGPTAAPSATVRAKSSD